MDKISVWELRAQQKGWTVTPIIPEWPKYLSRLSEFQTNKDLKSKAIANIDLFKKYQSSKITLERLKASISYAKENNELANNSFNYICKQLLTLAEQGKFNG